MPQVDSSAEQNLSSNFETLHHARAVKSPTRQQYSGTFREYQINSRGTV